MEVTLDGAGLIQQLQSEYDILWETPTNLVSALAQELTQEEEVTLNSAADLLVLFGASNDAERPSEVRIYQTTHLMGKKT